MRKNDFSNSATGKLHKLSLDDLETIQTALIESILALSGGLLNDITTPVIFYGCDISVVGTTYTMTAGAIFYNGEIYPVDAQVLVTASPVNFVTYVQPFAKDPVPYSDGSSFNVHVINKIKLSTAAGIGAYNALARLAKADKTPFLGGSTGQVLKKVSGTDFDFVWASPDSISVVTTATSNGLSLDFTVSSSPPYTVASIVYRYDYSLFNKVCNLSFSVDFDVTDGAEITEIRIPLPDGIAKDTTYRFYGTGVYYSATGTTSECPLEINIYKDGTEGQRMVLKRLDSAPGTIVSDSSIHVTIKGSIHFVTT